MGNISSCSTDTNSELAAAPEQFAGGAGTTGRHLQPPPAREGGGTSSPAELIPAEVETAAALLAVLRAALDRAADVLDVLCIKAARGERKAAVALLDRAAAAQAALSPAACELLLAAPPASAAVLLEQLNAVRALDSTAASEADSAAIVALLDVLDQFEENSGGHASAGDAQDQQEPAEIVALRAELRNRACAAGVDDDAVFDSDDPKAALVALLVQRRRELGALGDVLPALAAGGEEADSVLGACLEHAVEVLDSLSVSLSRRERKSVMELLDRVEGVASGVVDAEWCEGLVRCSRSELERLGSSVVDVATLVIGGGGGGGGGGGEAPSSSGAVVSAVLELLTCVERCGSTVLRALAVLSGGEQSEEVLVIALEALRLMSDDHQESVSVDEVAAGIAILPHMAGMCPLGTRVSASMALFTLVCRNGVELCSAEGAGEAICSSSASGAQSLVAAAASAEAAAGIVSADALGIAGATAALVITLLEVIGKCPLRQHAHASRLAPLLDRAIRIRFGLTAAGGAEIFVKRRNTESPIGAVGAQALWARRNSNCMRVCVDCDGFSVPSRATNCSRNRIDGSIDCLVGSVPSGVSVANAR
eukprot:SAG22_NODE_231_length_14551_cov_22.298090_19_plen_595_part_00